MFIGNKANFVTAHLYLGDLFRGVCPARALSAEGCLAEAFAGPAVCSSLDFAADARSKAARSSVETDRRGGGAPRWMLLSSAIKAFHIRSPPFSRSCARIESSLDAEVCRHPHAPMWANKGTS